MAVDSSLYKLQYWAGNCDVAYIAADRLLERTGLDLFDREPDDEVSPLTVLIPEDADEDWRADRAIRQSTELDFMMVYEDGVRFECTPKHSDIDIETAEIPLDMIAEAMAELAT